MDREAIMEKLQEICADVFGDPDLQVGPGTSAADVEAWDSLSHVNLMAAVEAAFDVRFTLGEMRDLKSLGEMSELLHELVNE